MFFKTTSSSNFTLRWMQISQFGVYYRIYYKIIPYKSASSVKSLTEDCKFPGKSFTYNKNYNGPRTVPCGTPDVTMMGF